MTLVEFINHTLGVLTIFAQALVILSVVYLLFFGKKYSYIEKFFSKNGLLFAFIVSLVATLGSLFFSDILGYEPCVLCWYQRILMYPQVIILGMAFWMKDKAIINYALVISGLGALLAGYHHLMQIGVIDEGSCGVVGYSISCAKVFVLRFGYITLPLMAFSAFALIIIFLVFARGENKN